MVLSAKHIVVWERVDYKSMECLQHKEEDGELTITSHITGVIDGIPFGIHYMIELDAQGKTQHFLISDLNNPDNVIELYADGKDKRFDRDEAVQQLEGCIDIDISLTPFTNTLPIRRLGLEEGQRTPIHVVYIRFPEFTVQKEQQYYTKLGDRRYLFEDTSGFSAELEVDADGLVIDYPGLARRLFPVSS